jgi:hypothetical protein
VTHYCFDIDGTICTNTFGNYAAAEPMSTAVLALQDLHSRGHRITLFTARGTGTGIDWREVTEAQLAEWGVPYDSLVFGKPEADVFVDDRAVAAGDWHATWTLPGMGDA